MRIIIIIIFLFVCNVCEGETVLHRYYDKVTGDEMGIAYSGKDGTPCVNNPDWNVEIISANQKQYYINLQQQQMKAKAKAIKDELKAKRKVIKDKLKAGTPLDQDDVDILVGESD